MVVHHADIVVAIRVDVQPELEEAHHEVLLDEPARRAIIGIDAARTVVEVVAACHRTRLTTQHVDHTAVGEHRVRMADAVVADRVVAGILRLGNLRIAPPPTERNRAVGGAVDVVAVVAYILAEEAEQGLHLTEVEAHIANVVVRDGDVVAEALNPRLIDTTRVAVADLVVLRVTHRNGITEQVVEVVTHDLRVADIVHEADGHGRSEVLEAVALEANAAGVRHLDRAGRHIDAVVFRRVPIAVGNILHGHAQRLNTAEAV